MSSGQEPI